MHCLVSCVCEIAWPQQTFLTSLRVFARCSHDGSRKRSHGDTVRRAVCLTLAGQPPSARCPINANLRGSRKGIPMSYIQYKFIRFNEKFMSLLLDNYAWRNLHSYFICPQNALWASPENVSQQSTAYMDLPDFWHRSHFARVHADQPAYVPTLSHLIIWRKWFLHPTLEVSQRIE